MAGGGFGMSNPYENSIGSIASAHTVDVDTGEAEQVSDYGGVSLEEALARQRQLGQMQYQQALAQQQAHAQAHQAYLQQQMMAQQASLARQQLANQAQQAYGFGGFLDPRAVYGQAHRFDETPKPRLDVVQIRRPKLKSYHWILLTTICVVVGLLLLKGFE